MATPIKKREVQKDEVEEDLDDDDNSDFFNESLDSDGSENSLPETEVILKLLLVYSKTRRLFTNVAYHYANTW